MFIGHEEVASAWGRAGIFGPGRGWLGFGAGGLEAAWVQQVGQGDGVQFAFEHAGDLGPGAAGAAVVGAVAGVGAGAAARDGHRALHGAHHVAQGDGLGGAVQQVPAGGPAQAADEPGLLQRAQDLLDELHGDARVGRQDRGAHGPLAPGLGQVEQQARGVAGAGRELHGRAWGAAERRRARGGAGCCVGIKSD